MPSRSEPAASPGAAFRHRDYRLYQVARFLSITATEAQSVAVAWQVYEITRRPLALGYVGLFQFLPPLLLLPIAGHAADRLDRRRILLGCYVLQVTASALLLWFSLHPRPTVLPIYGVLLLVGTARAFSGPAASALLPRLVPAEHFLNAVTWGATVFQIAQIVGPALGGLVYGLSWGWARGATTVYIVAIGMYASYIALIAALHARPGRSEKRATSLDTILAGFRYVWRERLILGSISLDLFAVLLGGAVALLPIFAEEILHAGPRGLGLLRSAPAVGAGVVAVWLAYRPLQRRAGATMFACVLLFGVATVVFGLSRSFWLSLVSLAVVGGSDMVSVIVRSALVQLATPDAMRGRVSAVNQLFVGASNEFGEFESGVTAQWFGAVRAVVYGGIGTCIVVALWAWRFPELARVERLAAEELAPAPPSAPADVR